MYQNMNQSNLFQITIEIRNILYVFQRQLDGYDFPVYSTPSCPRNATEWSERSSYLNCTKSNGYTCLPNDNFTELLEFCYTQPLIPIEEGNYSTSNVNLNLCAMYFLVSSI